MTKEDRLNWSTYATPAEGLSGRLSYRIKSFGVIEELQIKKLF